MTACTSDHHPMRLLKDWRELVDRELVAVGASALTDSKSLQASTMYVLQGGGKRLRALLALAIQFDIGRGDPQSPHALRPALALEMLHAASLVHDDLPALDDDDMRRGRPSCHRAFNEATAILTGDYLIGRAFSVVSGGSLTPLQQLRVLGVLAKAWGDLCIGQQEDIEKPNTTVNEKRVMELKTGALFGAAAACGAVCADGDELLVARFFGWGERVGVLFQKLDDIADGDGTGGTSFDTTGEIKNLLDELGTLHPNPLELTEAVYRTIVGSV